MRQILYTIVMSVPVSLILAAITVAWSVAILRRHKGEGAAATNGEAFRRALLGLVTFGSMGGQTNGKGPDLSIPGTLGTILLGLAVYAVVKEPVQLPIFGYAMAAACGFATAALVAGKFAAPRLGVDPKLALTVAFLCAFFGVLGARLFYVVEFWDTDFKDQSARIVFPMLDLSPGDELIAVTRKGNAPPREGRVRFQGDENTFHQLVARVNELKTTAGIQASLIEEPISEGHKVKMIERGFAIESVEGGDGVTMTLSGPALRKFISKAGYAIEAHGETIPWTAWFAVWRGGLVYYGGMIFGTAAILVFVWFNKIRPAQVGDLASAVGGFGVAWGRVGCFLNGCCFGRDAPGDAWWTLRFPPFSPAWERHVHALLPADPWDQKIAHAVQAGRVMPDDLKTALVNAGAPYLCTSSGPVHAVQLYSIVLDALCGVITLIFVRKWAKREGQTFFLWFIAYGIARPIEEHFRGDHWGFGELFGYPLTPSQRVALLTMPFATAGFVWATRRGRPLQPLQPLSGA